MTLEYLKTHGVIVDTLEYRGFKIDLYEDYQARQLVAIFQDRLIELGRDNTCYQDDLKLFIDEALDTITRFEDKPSWFNSKLTYFQNGSFRDIKLLHNGRTLKVYLCKDTPLTEEFVIKDAYLVLTEYFANLALGV